MASQSSEANRRSDQQLAEIERANLMTQLRAQIANQATTVFVALNAGGLAAIFAWLQTLPLQQAADTCEFIMVRSLPVAAGILLLGVIATVISYILRYRASFKEKRSYGWMVALAASALAVVGAGAWIGHSTVNCNSLAFDAFVARQLKMSLSTYRSAQTPDERRKIWDDQTRRRNIGHVQIQLFGPEEQLKQIVEIENTLQRIEVIRKELQDRVKRYGPENVTYLNAELERLSELELLLRKTLYDPAATK